MTVATLYFIVPSWPDLPNVFPICLTIFFLYIILVAAIRRSVANPILLFFSLYMLMCFCIPGLIHISILRFPFFNPGYEMGQILQAETITLVFVLAFGFGYAAQYTIIRSKETNTSMSVSNAVPAKPIMSARRIITAIFVLASTSILAGFIVGWPTLNLTRGDIGAEDYLSPALLIFSAICRVAGFLPLLYAVVLLNSSRSRLNWVLAAATSIFFLATNNPLSIPRYLLAAYLITFVLTHSRFRTFVKLAATVGICIGLLTIFPLMSDLSRGDISDTVHRDPYEYFATHGDFDGFQSTISVMSMVDGEGFRYGRQLLSAIFFFVPRAIWAEKSAGTGGDAATYMGFPFINLSAPLPAELYVDFGITGLVVLSLLIGSAASLLDNKFEQSKRRGNYAATIPIAFVAGYTFIILRGSLVGVLGPVVLSYGMSRLIERFVSNEPHVGS